MKMFVNTFFPNKLKTASRIYGNPIKIPMIRKDSVSCIEVNKIGENSSFGDFARIASLCVDFDLGTMHGYFLH